MTLSASFLPLLAGLVAQAGAMEAGGMTASEMERALVAQLAEGEAQPADGAAPLPPPPAEDWEKLLGADSPEVLIDGRRRPGYNQPLPEALSQDNPGAIRPPPPEAFPADSGIPVPDRWRIMTSLCPAKGADQSIFALFGNLRHVCRGKLDPYNQNVLKGDRALPEGKKPGFLKGDDWFFILGLTSDTVVEPRTFPIPNGAPLSERADINIFGRDTSLVVAQTFILGLDLFKGSTAFKPPEIEYKFAFAYNINYVNVPERQVLSVLTTEPSHRLDHFLGVQEAFVDYHIRNVSDRYDFDSVRVGIQPMQADFRGFLFNDNQLGIRFFGNRDNNRWQYNIALFRRLEKDTNSGLNTLVEKPRDDYVFIANVYRQDFLIPALTSQITLVYNRNREADEIKFDDNGFPIRPALIGNYAPRDYDVWYLGYNADGRIGRMNLTASIYGALGKDRNSLFTGQPANIRAFFAAAEASYDLDWARFRLSGLYASGDGDPQDDTENGFDAIFENPVFAGADTSYWIRQSIPLIGGTVGPVSLNGRNGILNSLRSSKDQGQSNFNNPGTVLVGAGADLDLTPEFRLTANANHLWFEDVSSLKFLRNQANIRSDIGWDLSASTIWRPKATQNIVLRLSGAVLAPGGGFKDLFANADRNSIYYSILGNLIVNY